MCYYPSKLTVKREWGGNTPTPPYVIVPCGRCHECRMARARAWQFRFMVEREKWLHSFFITLSYDDEHLPYYCIDADGEIKRHPDLSQKYQRLFRTLDKRSIQLIFKRLRNDYPLFEFKYYLIGEYGERFGRPHYHLLLFCNKDESFIDELLLKYWDKGNYVISDLIAERMIYVTKHHIGFDFNYEGNSIVEKPFRIMSKGIGSDYDKVMNKELVDWNKRTCDNSFFNYCGQSYYMPRYVRRRLYTEEQIRDRVVNDWQSIVYEHDLNFNRRNAEAVNRYKQYRDNRAKSLRKGKM